MSWPEVEQAKRENRHELILSGKSLAKTYEKSGFDKSLFDLQSLNYLNIHELAITEIPDDVGKLTNLTTLVFHTNKLASIPEAVNSLKKLKVLDCSRNQLQHLPRAFELPQLATVNLGSNLLKSLSDVQCCLKLASLDLSNNQLEEFPNVCHSQLVHLAEIKFNGNHINGIPNTINTLPALKVLDLADNRITVVPGELADCAKLKELNLKGNALTDKRLSKLVDQCRTKQVLDYVKQHCPKKSEDSGASAASGKSKKGKRNRGNSMTDNASAVNSLMHKLNVLKLNPEAAVIKITDQVKNVRPWIAACIVRDMTFDENTFKKFIQLQTKLHEGICDKRNTATIATHDLKLIQPGDLTYTAKAPSKIQILPLMRNKKYTAEQLFNQLQQEADNLRKEKKRNVYSGLHKYLYLLEGKSEFPCLMDSSKQVISLPPITNSDLTKMSKDTKDMLVEVTSTISQQVCRDVLDEFLKELLLSGLGCEIQAENAEADQFHSIKVEQVKIVDLEGNMKSIYPSRVDLNYEGNNSLTVVRTNA